MTKPLTTIAVAKARAGSTRREIADGGCVGLFLVVQPSSAKSWAARYRYRGRPTKLTLGSALIGAGSESDQAPEVGAPLSLASARELCARILREVQAGRDPAAVKRQRREQEHAAASDTFQAIAEEFLRRRGAELRTIDQRRADLELLYPNLGRLPIPEIRRGMFVREFDRISDQRGPVRANRTQVAAKALLNWFSARSDYVSTLTRVPARISIVGRARSRVLDDAELRAVWLAAEGFGLFGDLVRFLTLTAARRNEAAGLKRSELSADHTTWRLPAVRAKSKRDVVIPLSRAAQEIISARPQLAGGDCVFSASGRRPFNDFSRAKLAFDKACGIADWQLHDLRRSARSWLSRCGVRPDIGEMALGHSLGGVRAIYDRHKYEDELRAAFESLASLVERIVHPPADVVVPIRAKALRK
jgi:integrase